MKGVFITGATGNVGSRLVKEYLTQTDYQLYLLVRGESQDAAEERIARVLAFWNVEAARYAERLHVLPGDIVATDLGLSEAQRSGLRNKVQLVVHAASNLRLDLTPEQARREILGGTQNVVALAQSLSVLERFGYLSTMEVMGRYPGLVEEDFLTDHRIEFLNNYELGKFESEEYLRKEIEKGWPATILRVSMVVGEASTGQTLDFRTFYMLTEKFLLNPDFRILPAGAPLDVIPSDFLAAAIVRLMDYSGVAAPIYHLSQGLEDRMGFEDYLRLAKPVAEQALRRPLKMPLLIWPGVHRGVFRILTKMTFGRLRRFYSVQLIFLEFFGHNWRFDNRRTRRTLESFGMRWPRFEDYVPNLLAYYFAHREENRLPF